jgi:hypothetical protein
MIWIANIHKEASIGAGFLLALWVILRMLSPEKRRPGILKSSIMIILSVFFIGTMKPYMLQFLLAILLLVIFFQIIRLLPFCLFSFFWLVIYTIFVGSMFLLILKEPGYLSGTYTSKSWLSGDSYAQINQDQSFKWKKTPLVPEFIESKLTAMSSARASLIFSGKYFKANSMIDVNEIPASAIEFFRYLPRSFQVAWLAPFPNIWFKDKRLVNFVSSIEMMIYYMSFLGLLFYLHRGRFNYKILVCFIFAFVPLLLFGLTLPNIGTLYRVRYPFEMIFLTMGVCGWAHLIKKIKANRLN